jgi:hypothetical protein
MTVQITGRLPFGPEQYREDIRDHFVSNEIDSDEYGETAPWKLLGYVGDVAGRLQDSDHPLKDEFLEQVKVWVEAMGPGRYEGADSAYRLAEIIFDVLWDEGQHPYNGDDRQGFLDSYLGMIDDPDDEQTIVAAFAPFVAAGEASFRLSEEQALTDAERIKARRAGEQTVE